MNPALFQPAPKCVHKVRGIRGRSRAEIADYRHRRLLRTRDERPSGCRAEHSDELAAFQLIELHFRARQRRIWTIPNWRGLGSKLINFAAVTGRS